MLPNRHEWWSSQRGNCISSNLFAVKTHEQEQLELQKEDSLRLQIRQDIKEHNISLAEAANQAGIKEPKDYAIFQNEAIKVCMGVWA